ncbi:uncharacterized protein LOC131617193 [Vicia villosa]|uniref:uncharacterized protein LOC131617193 n=1 Tax=Vicia villosa TaxID=3911 RepID=UPI00273C905C|nr:uncharacterized protein LOC131617193 [Vicia villosa]
MSLQPPPQQPVQVYPTAVTNQPSSHNSNGNYGPVFIVLAILLVISVIGCFLGRLCNRRKHNSNNNNQDRPRDAPLRRPVKPSRQQQIHDLQSREEEDVELGGIDKRRPPPIITRPRVVAFEPEGRGFQPHGNGNGNGNVRDFDMKSDHEGDHQFRSGLGQ